MSGEQESPSGSARAIYVASPSGETGKSAVALGLVEAFAARVGRVGVFRPVVRDGVTDGLLSLLLAQDGVDLTYQQCVGVTYDQVHADPEAALGDIVRRYRELARQCDVVIVIGSDYTDVAGPTEFAYNARIAANLAAAVVLVVSARRREVEDIRQLVDVAVLELAAAHAEVVAVIANRADPAQLPQVRAALADLTPASWVLPEVPLLSAPTVRQLMTAVGGRLVGGDDELLDRAAESIVIGGMTMDHVLDRLVDGALVIVPGDRSEVVLAIVAAHAAGGFPSLAGLLLNGGYLPSAQVSALVAGLGQRLPLVASEFGTFDTARIVAETRGLLADGSQRKLDAAHALFAENVDTEQLLAAVDVPRSAVVTPLIFEYDLIERAKAQRRRIVLPEGDDDRILRAASRVLAREVADLTLLGDETSIRARASELGLDLSAATVVSTSDPELREEFAQEYARLRAHKGMTVDRAREIVTDVSYFGTLMVQLGLADGMVSGAAHTTAHTILPAFQIIGTEPGTSIVSSVFFMCLQNRVLVYGDCAINPDPTADQLADIAISSAATAARFGVQPRVAMQSYSTGASGSGADVEKVRTATELAKQRAPELIIDGPIQYDAAVDATVGKSKMPGSEVAGQATVFIFPDLNTGNNTYKAVQRSAGAVAVGPVLQGLRRPINDLSRGALVQDIVNTIAITAVQAQQDPS